MKDGSKCKGASAGCLGEGEGVDREESMKEKSGKKRKEPTLPTTKSHLEISSELLCLCSSEGENALERDH